VDRLDGGAGLREPWCLHPPPTLTLSRASMAASALAGVQQRSAWESNQLWWASLASEGSMEQFFVAGTKPRSGLLAVRRCAAQMATWCGHAQGGELTVSRPSTERPGAARPRPGSRCCDEAEFAMPQWVRMAHTLGGQARRGACFAEVGLGEIKLPDAGTGAAGRTGARIELPSMNGGTLGREPAGVRRRGPAAARACWSSTWQRRRIPSAGASKAATAPQFHASADSRRSAWLRPRRQPPQPG